MKRRPIIGITSARMLQEGAFLTGMPKTYVNSDYSDAVSRVRGLPVIIPPVCSEEEIGQFVGLCDGLLVSGGKDITPILYNTMTTAGCGAFDLAVDKCHIRLIRAFAAEKKPILGICRGLQLINVAFGGTLYQDLTAEVPESGGHSFGMFRYDEIHMVSVKKDSRLHTLLGSDTLAVNSIHHQAIKDLGEGVEVCGKAPDGIIEAVTVRGENIMGVQWHPEMMMVQGDQMLVLFEDLIRRCS